MNSSKFIESFNVSDYEVLTEDGWKDITHSHKTKKFFVWNIKTKNFNLECADEHIVIGEKFQNIFVRYLNIGDKIFTRLGLEEIISIEETEIEENMYDMTVDSDKHTYYTNGILSHNSTISTIYLLWYALFYKDKLIAIVADKEKTSKNILNRIKTAYKKLPMWIQQGIKLDGWNAKSISLENGSTLIISSTTGTALTGESISLLYIDEFAKIPTHLVTDFMDSVFPTIESSETAKIIIVSTPKGLNHWYEVWRKAISGQSDFFPIKINWWEIPGRDEKFKERIIKTNSLIHWNQEYRAVFIGSSSTLIDPDILEKIHVKDPIDFKIGNLLQIYEYPIKGCRYILGVDTAKGTGKDYSVIQVVKINNRFSLTQVALYRSNTISTTNYAQVVIEVSRYYNEAEIMIENNDIGDGVANSIWHGFEYDKIINCDSKGIGIRSTKKSKLEANLNLKKYMENGWLELCDSNTMKELSRYEEKEGKINIFAAGENENDDCVTSILWAVFFLDTKFYEDENETYDGIPRIDEKNKVSDNYPIIIPDGGMSPYLDDENMKFLGEGGKFF